MNQVAPAHLVEPRGDGRACSSPFLVLADADACHVATCRYHLPADELGHRCALLWSERGGMTVDEIAPLLGVSRARVGQIEHDALERPSIRALVRRLGIAPDDYAHAEAS